MIASSTFTRMSLSGWLVLASVGVGVPSEARSQSFPSNTVRIVVPAGPGSLPDVISRIIATELIENEGWRVITENRPGALSTLAMAEVLKQPPDGHSIFPLLVGSMVAPTLLPHTGVRIDTDFVPVVRISTSYSALVVTPSLPVTTVSDLIALLRSQPDKFNISASPFGTPPHLLAEVFKLQAGVNAVIVHYQQTPQRFADLMGGTTHFGFSNTLSVVSLIVAGKLRAVAVTSPKRIAALKDVPTATEQGFPDLTAPGEDWMGFVVRKGTPNDIVTRLNQAVNKILRAEKVRDTFAKLGAEPVGGLPTEFDALIKSQLVFWDGLVKRAGIKLPK